MTYHRTAMHSDFMRCWLTFLVAPIEGIGHPIVAGLGPDLVHPYRQLFPPKTDPLVKAIDRTEET